MTRAGSHIGDICAAVVLAVPPAIAYEKLFTTGLSRPDEAEADRIGYQLADAADYRAWPEIRLAARFSPSVGAGGR